MELRVIFALTLLARVASAQMVSPTWPLDSGTTIRVKAASLGPEFRRGTLRATTADSITIAPRWSGTLSVGLDGISSLQVLTESHTAKAKYSMIGLLVGAIGGAFLGAATYSPSKCDATVTFCIDVFDRGTSTAIGAVMFGAVGGLVGLMAGAAPKETWMQVPVPTR